MGLDWDTDALGVGVGGKSSSISDLYDVVGVASSSSVEFICSGENKEVYLAFWLMNVEKYINKALP